MNRYETIFKKQKAFFHSGQTKDIRYRIEALRKLQAAIRENEAVIMDALRADLNKSEFDAYSTEIGVSLEEIRFALKHIKAWNKPKKVKTPITHIGTSSYVYSDPYGIALIIAPWNYPFQLAIAPLVGALAAGNCVILKPSELAPRTSAVLFSLISANFPEEYIAVAEGGIETSEALLGLNVDYIFFTGSVAVGKVVMDAAAKHLTPVTLELGGKSPCIIHKDANIKLAAKRIAWGKFLNAGQTCIAPDYLYLHASIRDEFYDHFREATKELYGEKPLQNADFTRIISRRHFDRLKSFLADGKVYMGGESDEEKLMIEPTLLTGITWDSPIMQEEIFGPILPVMEYTELSEVIAGIDNHPNPLALYIFSQSEDIQQWLIQSVPFGGGCINDTVYHMPHPYLPFGGIGNSGIGSYHGKGSFDTFSHKKGVLKQTTKIDLPFRYPGGKDSIKKIKLFMK